MTNVRIPPFSYECGPTGVLLIHGFTASPTETQPLGLYLRKQGISSLGVRLAGHGSDEVDLCSTDWHDWYDSAREGFEALADRCEHIFVAGLSMGGLLAILLGQNVTRKLRGLILMAPALYLKSRLLFLSPVLKPLKHSIAKSSHSRTYLKCHGLFSYPNMPLVALDHLRRLITEARLASKHTDLPVQIAMGRLDQTVDPVSAPRIMEQWSNPHKQWLQLPSSGHILTVEPDAPTLFKAINHFITRLTPIDAVAITPFLT